MLSASAHTSCMRWVITTTVVPWSRSPRTSSNSRSTSASPSDEVASSRIRIFGRCIDAFVISTICRWSSGRWEIGERGSMCPRPSLASASSAILRAFRNETSPATRGMSESTRLCVTESSGTSESSWYTVAMPASCESWGDPGGSGWPFTRISPASRRTTPAMILTRVLLPAPFSPSNACTSARRTTRSAPTSAWMPPYCLWTPLARSASSAGSPPAIDPTLLPGT